MSFHLGLIMYQTFWEALPCTGTCTPEGSLSGVFLNVLFIKIHTQTKFSKPQPTAFILRHYAAAFGS